jgi:hypothetical protein
MVQQPAKKHIDLRPAGVNSEVRSSIAKFKLKLSILSRLHHHKSFIIGALFLATGITALLLSIYTNSQIIALIGLGMTFWGALFILISPVRYVEGDLLNSTAISMYLTVDRIIGDFKYSGKAYYIPPYSQEENLPENLKGLKEIVAFVSAKKEKPLLPVEELAQSKFMLSKKKGILVAPPGLGLLIETEKKIPRGTKMGISDLCEIVPKIMLENFAIAKDITMSTEADEVNLTLCDSLYNHLYSHESNLKSVNILGCPIASAIACAIAKTTGKIVTIENTKVYEQDLRTEIEYKLV